MEKKNESKEKKKKLEPSWIKMENRKGRTLKIKRGELIEGSMAKLGMYTILCGLIILHYYTIW
mgnify:CR=1 FL=1